MTFLPLITGNYWLLGGSVVKPITSFYEDLQLIILGRKTQTMTASCIIFYLNELKAELWIHSL